MANITKNTCANCIHFEDIGEGLECLNMVSFKDQGQDQFRSALATDSCEDYEPRLEQIYKHPDSDSQISVEHVNGEVYDHGVLIATDETGRTVRVPMGSIGLIEVGLALAGLGKKMVYA
jgi:hypothetical protein